MVSSPPPLPATANRHFQQNQEQMCPFSGTDVYPHMPILLRPHAARNYVRCISSVTFTSVHLYGNVYMRAGVACAIADFGLLGEQSLHKCVILCLGRRRTAVQNLTPLYPRRKNP